VTTQKTKLILWMLLLGGMKLCAQSPLELESKSAFFVVPGVSGLLTQDEYTARYLANNSVQASNAIEVSVMHFNDTAVVADQRKKASPKEKPKTIGPVIQISLVFTRPIFDAAFGTFSAADMAQIRQALAKFSQWKKGATSPTGTEFRRPFPQPLPWPVASETDGRVILTEQPLLFLRDQKGAAFLLLDKDKAFPGGMEKVAATTAAAGAAPAAGAAGAAGAEAAAGGAAAGAKVKYTDHWLSAG
ncbi:uncharacterized protein METZ01_LOCUS370477, partial [marine metagenome]